MGTIRYETCKGFKGFEMPFSTDHRSIVPRNEGSLDRAVSTRAVLGFASVIAATCVLFTIACTTANAAPLAGNSREVAGLSNDSLSPELRKAYAKFRARKITECLELLKEACAKDPELPPAQLILAQLYFKENKISIGRGALEQGVMEHPEYPECYLTLADLAWSEGRVAEASLSYDHAMKLAEKFEGDESRKRRFKIRAISGQINVMETRKQWAEALKNLDLLLELDPENSQAMYRRGISMFKTGKAKAAYEALKAASDLSDDLSPPAVTLGRLYEQDENRPKANQWMQFAAKEGRTDARTRREVARWLWETEQYDEARTHAEAAVQLDGDDNDASLILGIVLRYLKDYVESEKVLEKVYLKTPSSFDASNQLALVLIDQNDEQKHNRALALAQVNASRFPKTDRKYFLAHATLGWIQYRMRNIDDAERNVRTSGGTSGITSDMAYFMAAISAEREKFEEAKSLLRRALDTPGPFAYRGNAQQLYDRLNK